MFVRTENFKSYIRYYPITAIIILINVVMFIIMTMDGGSTNNETLVKYGAFISPIPENMPFAEYGRLISSVFLHIGFEHLLFNGFSLLVFTPAMERILGHIQYIGFYLVAGIAGNLATHVVNSQTFDGFYNLSAGASGAIFGVFGGYLAIVLLRRALLDTQSSTTIITLLVISGVYSFMMPDINWIAHAGGFVAGFVWVSLLIKWRR